MAQIRERRDEVCGKAVSYHHMRDERIISFLPHTTHLSRNAEKRLYQKALEANGGYLEAVLYGAIWDDLQPNERLAIEHLYYEDARLVDGTTGLYANLHAYVHAKHIGDEALAKQWLKAALWEILHNSLPEAENVLVRDKARRRRKAQAAMLNSLNVPTVEIHTPDYIVQPIREHYQRLSLEALLPEIAFPLEETARELAETIQQINADIQAQLLGQKSIVTESSDIPEATEAFTQLYVDIIAGGTRKRVEDELDKQARKGSNAEQINEAMSQTLQSWQDVTLPDKIENLATHFNGRLTQARQTEAGVTHYIWRSMDDDKVRHDHAANDDQIFAWDNPPPTGHPGDAYNCRCYAEPVPPPPQPQRLPDDRIDPVYPELILIPALRLGRIVVGGLVRIGSAIGSIFRNPISRRPQGVPKDWVKSPSKNQGGYRYRDPKNEHNEVRVQKGDPNRSNPGQRQDYVRWKKDGHYMDKNGKRSTDEGETHIPIEDFKFDPRIFK